MDDLELALDECLQQLGSGKASLAQCLDRYPQHAAELRPLLEAALLLQQGKQVRPSGAMRDRGRTRLREHMRAHPRRARQLGPMQKLALSLAGVVFAALAVGTAAAQGALPGQPLYPLKLNAERAWRAASPDPVSVDISIAGRRTDELLTLAGDQSPKAAPDTIAESDGIAAYNDVLSRLSAESRGPQGGQILHVLEVHQQRLDHAGIHVPELDTIVEHGQSGAAPGQNNNQP